VTEILTDLHLAQELSSAACGWGLNAIATISNLFFMLFYSNAPIVAKGICTSPGTDARPRYAQDITYAQLDHTSKAEEVKESILILRNFYQYLTEL
jgi:hypothetical protein